VSDELHTHSPALQVSDDDFLGGALHMLQPRDGYRAGLDAVMLAAAAVAGPGARALDVGSGVGVAGLALAHRARSAHVILIERDAWLVGLARQNIERNGMCSRARVIQADVAHPLNETPELAQLAETFDCVLANPPYYTHGCGTASQYPIKAASHAMPEGGLTRWARFMAAMARPGGSANLILTTRALPDLLAALHGRFGALLLLPIYPHAHEPATRVIVQGVKGSRAPLQMLPGLILHETDGRFRPDVEQILRHGAPLSLRRPA
jgi:tRNA1(Val) A37 N6-methylase TrmN6